MMEARANTTNALTRVRNDISTYFARLPLRPAIVFSIARVTKMRHIVCAPFDGMNLWLRTQSHDLTIATHVFSQLKFSSALHGTTPKVIVDAGAYTGLSTAYFAKHFPDATVYAIEMPPGNFEMLQRNTQHFSNVRAIHAALAGVSGHATVLDRSTGEWGFSIASLPSESVDTGCSVKTVTLDDILSQYGIEHIDFLKLDVEGAEREIFVHGGRWLQITDRIQVELHDHICTGCEEAFDAATSFFPHKCRIGGETIVSMTELVGT